jgi:hypothetical protein
MKVKKTGEIYEHLMRQKGDLNKVRARLEKPENCGNFNL